MLAALGTSSREQHKAEPKTATRTESCETCGATGDSQGARHGQSEAMPRDFEPDFRNSLPRLHCVVNGGVNPTEEPPKDPANRDVGTAPGQAQEIRDLSGTQFLQREPLGKCLVAVSC